MRAWFASLLVGASLGALPSVVHAQSGPPGAMPAATLTDAQTSVPASDSGTPGATAASSGEAANAASAPVSVEERLGLLHQAINNWDYPGATALVAQLEAELDEAKNPSPYFDALRGELAFHLGDYPTALAWLEGAAPVNFRQGVYARDVLALVRRSHELTKDYVSFLSPDGHFEIVSEPKDALLAPFAAEVLEQAYYEVGYSLGFWPQERIRVEILPRAKLLAVVSPLPEEAIKTTSTIGLCKYNKLMVTSPRGTLRGYGWRDTLTHEYVHLVISQKTKNRVPIWLHEGVAKYFETRWSGDFAATLEPQRETLLRERVRANTLVPLAKMSPSIALLPSQEDATVAYAEVFSLVEFLVERRGRHAIRHVMDRIAAGTDVEAAFADEVGESWTAFERRWMAWLRNTRPTVDAPADFDDRLMLIDDPSAEAGDFAGIDSPAARDHLQLGELLRARGFAPAALEEYRRAEALLGPVHPIVQNGAARVLLEQGDNEGVLAALEQVTRWYPSYYFSFVSRATALNNLERFDEALVEADAAMGVNPFDPRIHTERARAFAGLGRSGDADAARLIAAELAP